MMRARMFLAGLLSAPAVLIGYPLRIARLLPIVGKLFGWLLGFCQAWVQFCLTYVAGVPVPELLSMRMMDRPARRRAVRLAARLGKRGRR
jgi:hypothetical protein